MCEGLAGDAASYRALLTEIGRPLRRYFLRRLGRDRAADTEDLVQETLMAVHTRRETYDTAMPFTPWLHAIARYKLIDHLRRSYRDRTVPIDEGTDLLADEGDAIDSRLDAETVLAALPAKQRSMVRAVKLEGHSIADVATRTGLSPSAVKVTIHRSLRALGIRFAGSSRRDDDT